jgi:hypothetical protein
MYCKECGKSIDDDSKYCRFCGTFQNNPEVIPPSTIPQARELNVNIHLSRKPQKPEQKEQLEEPVKKKKFDESYQKEIGASIVGGLLIIINTILLASGFYAEWAYSLSEGAYVFFSIGNIVWRIVAAIWVVNIATRQNRTTTGWGVFGFLLPNLALLIIGALNKKFVEDLPTTVQVSETLGYSEPFEKTYEDPANIEKEELMKRYNIKLIDGVYIFETYRFEKFIDALNYAKFIEARNYSKTIM